MKLQVPPDPGSNNIWADPYNAGIAHIAPDSSVPGHVRPPAPQLGGVSDAASSQPALQKSSRPAYNPMQDQAQQLQGQPQPPPTNAPTGAPSFSRQKQQPEQQQRLQQHDAHSHPQTALAGGSAISPAHLPSEEHRGAGRPSQTEDGRATGQPGSARSYNDSAGTSQAAEQYSGIQSRSADPFSDLLHPDLTRRLSIHDRDLWSKLHSRGDM